MSIHLSSGKLFRHTLASSEELELIVAPDLRSTAFLTISAPTCTIDCKVEAGASLEIVCLCTPETSATVTQRSRLADGARIHWVNVVRGNVEQELISTLDGANAESSVDWIALARGKDRQTLRARNVFLGRSGGGEIAMRGVAEEKAVLQFHGMIAIGPGGGGTNTYLTQEALMLDATAKVDAVPALEIKTNDVKASHSATVARITEEDLFQFGARGIAPAQARAMFIDAFLGALTERIGDSGIREDVLSSLA